jgi:hypothetical protein
VLESVEDIAGNRSVVLITDGGFDHLNNPLKNVSDRGARFRRRWFTGRTKHDLFPDLQYRRDTKNPPVRILFVVKQSSEPVLSAIKAQSAVYEWFLNEWAHLAMINPDSKEITLLRNGEFVPYKFQTQQQSIDFTNRFKSRTGRQPAFEIY